MLCVLQEGCPSTGRISLMPGLLDDAGTSPDPQSHSPTRFPPQQSTWPSISPKIWLQEDGRGKAPSSAATSAPSRLHAPVRMDWSTRRVVDRISMIRMSAGTLSPTTRTRAEQLRQAGPAAPAALGKGDGKPQTHQHSRALPQGLQPLVCTSVPAVSSRFLFQLSSLQGRDWLLLRIATSLCSAGAQQHPACGNEGSSPW